MNNISIDIDKLINNNDFIIKFKSLYPDLDLNTLDNTIIIDIAFEMYLNKIIDLPKITNTEEEFTYNIFDNNDIKKEISNLVEEFGINPNYKKINLISLNRIKADNEIPELFVPGELIIISGKLLEIPVKILLDTGASNCCILKSTITRCGLELEELVDNNTIISIQSLNNLSSFGKIWYTELFIQDNKKDLIKFPITFEIIDNISSEFDLILGSNFLRTYNVNINYNKCLVTISNSDNMIFNINFI